jgi:MFS family permease
MGTQTLFDYPTGVIGDWIGPRYILATSFITYSVAYYLVSFVTVSSPLVYFFIIYGLMGFASSQASGALGSWFDNNWRVAMPEDEGAQQYGVFMGKINMLLWLTNVLVIIPGGILAVVFGRPWVFRFQALLCLFIAIGGFLLVKNLSGANETMSPKRGMDEYITLMKGCIEFLFSNRNVTYFLFGSMLVTSCITVWGNLILYPMYYQYLVTDVAVASLRTIVMIPLVFYSERSGVWAKNFEPKKWIPRFSFIQTCGALFFWIFAGIMLIFEPPPVASPMTDFYFPFTNILILRLPISSIIPVTLIISTFVICGAFLRIVGVLMSRVYVHAIPNKNRNSVYSLLPTVILLLAMPQITLFGWVISSVGIPTALVLLGGVSSVGVVFLRRGLGESDWFSSSEEIAKG